MAAKLIIFSACVVAALAQSAYRPAAYVAPAQYYNAPRAYVPAEPAYPPTPYQFEYSVNDPTTYDVKSQSESSDGAGNVKGVYSVLESDGSTRIVEYTAGAEGFNAVVKKADGAAYKAAPAYTAPAYRAPAPVYATPAPVYATPAPVYAAPAYRAAVPAYRPAYVAPAYTPAPAAFKPY